MTADIPALEVSDLSISYRRRGLLQPAVQNVSFTLAPGGRMGLVGESGSGKTTVAMAILRYLPRNAVVTGGSVKLDGQELLTMRATNLRKVRGSRIAAVYQDPGSSLNPTMKVGRQVAEVFQKHFGMSGAQAQDAAVLALDKVHLPSPELLAGRYPHQLSGGQQQRVMIAMALAPKPSVLVLDEPTTGLDATVEAAVIELIEELSRDLGTALLMVSHNLPLVRHLCEDALVMKSGELVESGRTLEILAAPRHAYTRELVDCVPSPMHRKFTHEVRGGAHVERSVTVQDLERLQHVAESDDKVLDLVDLVKDYETPDGVVHAVRGVTLSMSRGEILAIVGESGSGKSTLAKCVVGLESYTKGSLVVEGEVMPRNHLKRDRSGRQRRPTLVFQNPETSLNPSKTARSVLTRALRLAGEDSARVDEVAGETQLRHEHLDSKTRRLSGGLKQRVAIARASVGNPTIVVCDEPVSALDVSVQASILNLLAHRQAQTGVSYLFISHDLGVVHYLADSVAVMYMGEVLEQGPVDEVFAAPQHPYTAALMSAVNVMAGEPAQRIELEGPTPSAYEELTGCIFASRCPVILDDGRCTTQTPEWRSGLGSKRYRCHREGADLQDLFGDTSKPQRFTSSPDLKSEGAPS